MKEEKVIAAISLALLFATFATAGNARNSQNQQGANKPIAGEREAMRMVPARAALLQTLDADKTKPGYRFEATLSKTVKLDNGPELPEGTVLVGTVVTDDMNVQGASKLALRFTEAKLKDGMVVPIKATIVGVYKPRNDNFQGYPVAPGDQVPNSWNDGTLQVDQIAVLSGVDLHSKIASMNSGVLVSTTKDNMKLEAGSEFALAIAQQKRSS